MQSRNQLATDLLLVSMTGVILMLASCPLVPVGDFLPFIGPSGGYVFYENPAWEAGSQNPVSNWRYLEAAPSDIIVDSNDVLHIFGYHRVEGSNSYIGTNLDIGTGMTNTNALVTTMGVAAYDYDDNTKNYSTTGTYAAKLCNDFSINSLDDWFLPSRDELKMMYLNLHRQDLGDFSNGQYYWSSSEHDSQLSTGKNAWRILFDSELDLIEEQDDIYNIMARHWNGHVRPIRYYTPD